MASSANLVLACTALLLLSWAPCPTSSRMMMESEACDLLCPGSWGGGGSRPSPGWKRGRSYYGRGLSARRGGRISGREGSAPGQLSQGDWVGILISRLGSIIGLFFDFDSILKLASNILERSWSFTKKVFGPIMFAGGKKPVKKAFYNELQDIEERGGPGVPIDPNPGEVGPQRPEGTGDPDGGDDGDGELHIPFRIVIDVPFLMGLLGKFLVVIGVPEVGIVLNIAAAVAGAFRLGRIDVTFLIEKLYNSFARAWSF